MNNNASNNECFEVSGMFMSQFAYSIISANLRVLGMFLSFLNS